jgi:uncharacterized protein (TIGR02246 family)
MLAAALTLILNACIAPAAQQTKPHPVHDFFMAGISAFNEHDLDTFMKQFASDIEMYTPTGWLRGHEAVRQRFVETFKQFPAVRMEIEDLVVREVAPGTAITSFKWRVYPMGKGPAFHGVGSGVYVLRNGTWAEVLEHETVVKVDEGLGPPKKQDL